MQVRTRTFRPGMFRPITNSPHCKFVPYIENIFVTFMALYIMYMFDNCLSILIRSNVLNNTFSYSFLFFIFLFFFFFNFSVLIANDFISYLFSLPQSVILKILYLNIFCILYVN